MGGVINHNNERITKKEEGIMKRVSSRRRGVTRSKKTLVKATGCSAVCTEEMVKERAYYIWENMGRPDGKDQEIWYQAEKEMK